MRLRIVTPLSVVVDGAVDSLRAQDASGSFGIRLCTWRPIAAWA